MIKRPDAKPGAAVDSISTDGPEDSRILRAIAVVAHDEILVRGNHSPVSHAPGRWVVECCPRLRQVWLVKLVPVDVNDPIADQQLLAGKRDDALDEVQGVVCGWSQDDDVAALRWVQRVVDLVGDQV